jgi:hypothetical protein
MENSAKSGIGSQIKFMTYFQFLILDLKREGQSKTLSRKISAETAEKICRTETDEFFR